MKAVLFLGLCTAGSVQSSVVRVCDFISLNDESDTSVEVPVQCSPLHSNALQLSLIFNDEDRKCTWIDLDNPNTFDPQILISESGVSATVNVTTVCSEGKSIHLQCHVISSHDIYIDFNKCMYYPSPFIYVHVRHFCMSLQLCHHIHLKTIQTPATPQPSSYGRLYVSEPSCSSDPNDG